MHANTGNISVRASISELSSCTVKWNKNIFVALIIQRKGERVKWRESEKGKELHLENKRFRRRTDFYFPGKHPFNLINPFPNSTSRIISVLCAKILLLFLFPTLFGPRLYCVLICTILSSCFYLRIFTWYFYLVFSLGIFTWYFLLVFSLRIFSA